MAYLQNIDLPSTGRSKVVTNYTFDPINKTIKIKESITAILYVFSYDTNRMIYNPSRVGFGGSLEGNILLLDYDTTSIENNKGLLIIADYDDKNDNTNILNALIEQQILTNNLLKLILS